ncbi:MAG: MgtC/SapB family protein [Acidobacteriota bacterium]|nr:MgtC/SapB family protein [Acidobacteriota bacterium]
MTLRLLFVALMLSSSVAAPVSVLAQGNPIADAAGQPNPAEQLRRANEEPHDPDHFLHELDDAMKSLPLAALLGAALALRPRRKGTPPRQASVIQTQIILAVVGTVVMLVVGQSLARAFGIVGVASLIRYRAKVDDPKDAVVMLCCLGMGLASGVGLYALALMSTVFLLVVLFILESFEPVSTKLFEVTIQSKADNNLRSRIEQVFKNSNAEYELRSVSEGELVYEVRLPFKKRTDRLSTAIVALDSTNDIAVEWKEKRPKQG